MEQKQKTKVQRLTTFEQCDSLDVCTSRILSEPNLLGASIKVQGDKFILEMVADVECDS